MSSWFDRVTGSRVVARLAETVRAGGSASLRGIAGSSTTVLVASLARTAGRPLLYVVPHLDDADEAQDELRGFGFDAARLPAMEVMPGETSVNLELLAERLTLLRCFVDGAGPPVVVAPMAALMQAAPDPERLEAMLRVIRPGDRLDVDALASWLHDGGYRRVDTIESPGEFAIRGGIVDLHPPGAEPCRIDLFDDEVEHLFAIDLDTMGSDRALERIELVAASADALQADQGTVVFSAYVDPETVVVLHEVSELTEQGRSYYDRVIDAGGILGPPAVFAALERDCTAVLDVNQFTGGLRPEATIDVPVRALPTFDETASTAVGELAELSTQGSVVVVGENAGEVERFVELRTELAPDARVPTEVRYLHRGFVWDDAGDGPSLTVVPYHELLHRYHARRRVRRVATSRTIDAFVDLQPGDHVVHREHGIARFLGLRTLEDRGGADEYLVLEFAKSARLNVPVTRIELVQKYIGAFSGKPELSTLGGKRWKRQKDKVADAVRELAGEMLRLQAAREALPGIRFPADTVWQREFEAEFPYQETEDQLTALQATKRDMSDPRPMDRLICGDVGFGKTEIAIRAAFKAAEFGKQVAVLVPTTVLADQHERTFNARFADYPFRIEAVSRFKSKKDVSALLAEVKQGKVDIIIGTHRLLSDDVSFADLGLVVIDEEQRFGVEHKQKLLSFRATADVMTLSATPIPRTLHMAILGLRDISSLTTPPLDRRSIVTEVIPARSPRIAKAITRELAREGQIFVVHNRVNDIMSVADDIRRLAPDARIVVGHGQMPGRELESVMRTFIRGDADILVSTTIIESGIDIPTANTMVILNAHMFGLSELHQLRGRVGRYKHRAYCYLVLPEDKTVSDTARRRLNALESFSMLGAGFKIALRDLELRGAGNLLGAEQSGHIAAVGYEMYCQLLEQAVGRMRDGAEPDDIETTVELGVAGSIPSGYVPSDARRMDVYRRLTEVRDPAAIERLRADLESAYGPVPARVKLLFSLAEIRVGAALIGVRAITRRDGDVVFRTARPSELERCMKGVKGTLRMVGGVSAGGLSTIYYRPPKNYFDGDTLLTVLRHRLWRGAGVGEAVEV